MNTKCDCEKFNSDLQTSTDISNRCNVSEEIIKNFRTEIVGNWRTLQKCLECGANWIVEYPYSERHGGGPKCAYMLKKGDVNSVDSLDALDYLTTSIIANESREK